MLLLSLYLFIHISKTDTCDFKKLSADTFELKIDGKGIEIPVLESDAKLVKCEASKNFENLYIAEIDGGTAGTKAKTNQVYLYVLRNEPKELKVSLKRKIKEIVKEFDPITGKTQVEKIENPYRLDKSKKGEAIVYWIDEKKSEVLN